jgi:hypothetical protein
MLDDRTTPHPPRRTPSLALLAAFALGGCAAPSGPEPATPRAPQELRPTAAAPPSLAPHVAPPAAAPPAAPAEPAPKAPVLKAVDVYGTDRIDAAWVKSKVGEKLQRYFDTEDEKESDRLEKEIVDAILAENKDLGWIKLSAVVYYDKGDVPQGFITVDVVEREDMKARLTFGPQPKGDFEDPDGLLAAWKEYESTYFRMLREQKISPQRVACPAFHCMGGYEHEALRPFGEKFVNGVSSNQGKLARILKEDKDPKDRAAAAFLLAHIKDGRKLVDLMLPARNDPDTIVRNNASRVLLNVAMFHHDIPIPLKPLLGALNGPTMYDRNKAVAVVSALLERPDGSKLHAEVIRDAGPALIKLLELEQPNNHDFAYTILKRVSGKDLGERDYETWRKWLDEQRGKKGAAH